MSKITVIRKNPGALGKILARYVEVSKKELAEGWTDEQDPESVTIAAINYFGTDTIPARDALGPASQTTAKGASEVTVKVARAANRDQDAVSELTPLENRAASDMKRAVREFNDPGNADSTIKKKGYDDPLIGDGGGRILDSAGAKLRGRRD